MRKANLFLAAILVLMFCVSQTHIAPAFAKVLEVSGVLRDIAKFEPKPEGEVKGETKAGKRNEVRSESRSTFKPSAGNANEEYRLVVSVDIRGEVMSGLTDFKCLFLDKNGKGMTWELFLNEYNNSHVTIELYEDSGYIFKVQKTEPIVFN